jgi:hypothetical protein
MQWVSPEMTFAKGTISIGKLKEALKPISIKAE